MTDFSAVTNKAHQLAEMLRAEGYDDDAVLLSIESETDLLRVFDRVAERVDQDNRSAVIARERARRLEARADKNTEFLGYLMEVMGIEKKIERPTATVYYQNNPPKLEITGEVPDLYTMSVPDKQAIMRDLKQGDYIANCTLTQSRSLRVKSS